MPELQLILYYLLVGLFVGYFSGLLGIGGGLVMLPLLAFLFEAQNLPAQNILHLALGTSMATILFISLFSTWQHHVHRAVNWRMVRFITLGILLGTALGALIVGYIATYSLTIFFILFVYFSATQMLLLAAAALGTWRAKTSSVEWKYALPVNIYLVNGDGSEVTAEYLRGLQLAYFKPIEAFMQEEAARYGRAARASITARCDGQI